MFTSTDPFNIISQDFLRFQVIALYFERFLYISNGFLLFHISILHVHQTFYFIFRFSISYFSLSLYICMFISYLHFLFHIYIFDFLLFHISILHVHQHGPCGLRSTHVHVYVYVCVYIYIYTIYTYMCIYIYIYMYTWLRIISNTLSHIIVHDSIWQDRAILYT